MKRIVIAAILGGLAVFVAGAISHMATPLGSMGFSTFPQEDQTLETLRGVTDHEGLYLFPGENAESHRTPEAQAALSEKVRRGPTGLLLIHPQGSDPNWAPLLLRELASNMLAALLLGFVLSHVAGGYGRRVLIAVLLGVFAWLSLSVSYWTWYGFPSAFTVAEGLDQMIGWLVGGAVIAKIVPAPRG